MLDRIDIHVDVPRVDYEKLSSNRLGEPSANVQARVEAARSMQRERFKGTDLTTNADMHPKDIRLHCQLDADGKSLLKSAMKQLHLSARSYHRVLKLSRTITDLAGEEEITSLHLAEALQYQPREDNWI